MAASPGSEAGPDAWNLYYVSAHQRGSQRQVPVQTSPLQVGSSNELGDEKLFLLNAFY